MSEDRDEVVGVLYGPPLAVWADRVPMTVAGALIESCPWFLPSSSSHPGSLLLAGELRPYIRSE